MSYIIYQYMLIVLYAIDFPTLVDDSQTVYSLDINRPHYLGVIDN